MNENKEFKVDRKYAHYVFALLFMLYAFDYIDRMVIASLFPYLKADWGITDTQCGWLASIVTIVMTFLVAPISLLVDRWSRKKTIGIMALLWGLSAGACAFARNFRQLFVLRSVIGVGEAAYSAGGFAIISAYYPEEKRATMNGLFTAAIPLGTAAGVVLGGAIAVNLGWQYAFGLTAIPGIIVALLFFWVKDYKTVKVLKAPAADSERAAERKTVKEVALDFIRTPSLIMTYMGYIGNTFVSNALITWMPTYYHRTEGLSMDKAGMKTSLIFLLAIIGAPVGGIIADRWRKNRVNARMALPAITSLLSAVFIGLAFIFAKGQLQYIFLLLFGFTAPIYATAGSAVTQDVVHPGLRATSYSMCQVFQMALGYSLSPIFVGFISDRYDLLTAFQFLPVFMLLGSIVFFIGSFFYERDLNKVEKIVLVEG